MNIVLVLLGGTIPPNGGPSIGNTIGTWLGIVGGLAGLLVLIAGLVVAARGSYNKAKIASLREDLDDARGREDDARKREDDRKSEIKELEHHLAVCESKVDGLFRENTVLKDLVTQRVEIGALQSQIESQREEIVGLKVVIEENNRAEREELISILETRFSELAEVLEQRNDTE